MKMRRGGTCCARSLPGHPPRNLHALYQALRNMKMLPLHSGPRWQGPSGDRLEPPIYLTFLEGGRGGPTFFPKGLPPHSLFHISSCLTSGVALFARPAHGSTGQDCTGDSAYDQRPGNSHHVVLIENALRVKQIFHLSYFADSLCAQHHFQLSVLQLADPVLP